MTSNAEPPPDPAAGAKAPAASRAPRFAARLADFDIRLGTAITIVVALAVLALSNIPLRGSIELDLRQGDDVGGWSQLTLVGFTVAQPFGRTLPDQPGRDDLRIVSNRPLPAAFELELEGWWPKASPPGPLEVSVGSQRHTLSFGREPTRAVVRVDNPEGSRIISLRLPSDDELAVRRIAIHPAGGAS